MIVQIIMFAILISGGLLGAVYLNKRFEEILPAHLMVTMLVLYFCGLVSKLQIGVYIVLSINIISYIVSIIGIIRKKNIGNVIEKMITPAFVIFTLIFCIFTYADLGMLAHSWDEFSHWVDSVKAMTYVNDFVTNPEAEALFQFYPPAMALMQYLVSNIYLMLNRGGTFCEWRVFLVFQMFSVSMFMPFLSNEKFRNPIKLICHTIVLMFIPLFFYNEFWSTVYIDPFIGILAGTAFCFIILKNDDVKLQCIYICLLCSTLILSKDVGLYFAIFISIGYMIKWFMNNRRLTIKNCLIAMFPLCASILTKLSWKYELITSGARINFGGKIDLLKYTRLLA